MFDSASARRMMVDGQVRTADVHNPDLLAAMLTIPRERFVPPSLAEQAYIDSDIEIATGRVLLKPMVLRQVDPGGGRARQRSCARCGMRAWLFLGRVVAAGGFGCCARGRRALASQAKAALAAAGASGVTVATGPLTAGWPAGAPYDFILLNGATEIVPEGLAGQLKPNGRLACIFGRAPAAKAMIYRLAEGRLVGRPAFDAAAPVLPGFVAPPAFVF